MELSIDDYVRHILDEAEFLHDHAGSIQKGQYLHDPILKRAFVPSIEIIGEAVKNCRTIFENDIRRSNGG